MPQVGYTTGDLDIHDLAVDADGRLVFVNTLFGCLARLSETHSFRPCVSSQAFAAVPAIVFPAAVR